MALLNDGKLVQYNGKVFRVLHVYDSNYCEIVENSEGKFVNVLLVKSSELQEINIT